MVSLWLWVLLLGIALTEGVPIVNTIYGPVSGRTRTLHTGVTIDAYYGIPFTKPPVGDLRWRPPQEPDPWEEVFVATELPSACPQSPRGLLMITHPLWDNYDEDCLSINIFAPNSTSGAPYPVMVWFHGGGYVGSANVQYPGYYLAGKDVVVAIPNYRLGNLGYASTEDEAAPGNYGLMDQVRALEFVRDNIAAFGGDPNKVTIFGQSAGAASSGLLLLSPKAEGLFHQAIQESGSDLAIWSVNYPDQEPANYTRQVALSLGCPIEDSFEMIECMRQLPFDDVRQAGFTCKPGHFCQGMAPVVDGPDGYLPDLPYTLRKQGRFKALPMINGHCKDDGSPYTALLVPGSDLGFNRTEFLKSLRDYLVGIYAPTWPDHEDDMFEAFNFYYTPWPHIEDRDLNREKFNQLITDFGFGVTGDEAMKFHSEVADVYFYILGYRSSKAAPLIPEWMGVPHNGEIPYVLGWPFLQYDPLLRLDSGILIDIIRWDEEDVEWAEYFTNMWVNFAKYGNPTPEPVAAPGTNEPTVWPKFSDADQQYLYADRNIEYLKDYRQQNFALFNYYMPYIVGRRDPENPEGTEAELDRSDIKGMPSDFVEKAFSEFYQKAMKV